jgi:hypothetical protein
LAGSRDISQELKKVLHKTT